MLAKCQKRRSIFSLKNPEQREEEVFHHHELGHTHHMWELSSYTLVSGINNWDIYRVKKGQVPDHLVQRHQ